MAPSSKGSKGQSVGGQVSVDTLSAVPSPRKDGGLQVLIDPSVCQVQSRTQIQPGTRQTGLLSQQSPPPERWQSPGTNRSFCMPGIVPETDSARNKADGAPVSAPVLSR